MFPKHALVRPPGRKYRNCISLHPLRHTIDLPRALKQHEEYCQTLKDLGLELIKMPANDEHPDSCFVEDTAIIHKGKALITRLAKESRRGEEDSVAHILKDYLKIKKATPPATIEGGDVVHLPTQLLIGISQRTNTHGINQLKEWLDTPVATITDKTMIHLKSYISYIGKGTIITTQKYAHHPLLHKYRKIITTRNEHYTANTLIVKDTVIIPQNHPTTQKLIKEYGFDVVPLNITEFQKCEGALTCLSLIF